ncbi:PREDICTED: uncharacterized protein LOC106817941 isoform X1 [Priapulus caudatus]|uniref:Uncharacterized protein LOC106817941 isoform X1 n=1 Tax=Priapulus caudatus TaxID=37621 RepID=A0ABM1F112_PRICU|nr:PREDICTED: uncharacterized protein LOC106817941 isoform X1 [Priapulus caudatus]
MAVPVIVGVDVGGTNTDAILLAGDKVVGSAKRTTTRDVTGGVLEAISAAIRHASANGLQVTVQQVHIGTTHFINAVIQRKHLVKVSVLRLCGPASTSLPPFCDIPVGLGKCVYGSHHLIGGGYQFDGSEISKVDPEEVKHCIREIYSNGIRNVVIAGIFSSVDSSQETQVCEIIRSEYPDVTMTLSHLVGQLGLLERENAAILNESLKPLCRRTLEAFRGALDKLQLHCPFFLTQNDGTLISSEKTLEYPVHTFASGSTNSMRGAAYLSGVNDAIVCDVGGTSTDVGALVGGFPREASTHVKIGEVRTNFRMPDVTSIGLGGGSLVTSHNVGPLSVGYQLSTEGQVFGGATLTATDIAVAAGMCSIGDASLVKADAQLVAVTMNRIHDMVETIIDKMKVSASAVPVVLVGGGSILVDPNRSINGVSSLVRPKHYDVANAVGAALSQVSGAVDTVANLALVSRQAAIEEAKQRAIKLTVDAGALPTSIRIVDIGDVPLTYLPGNATRIKVKAVGDLDRQHILGMNPTVICEEHGNAVAQLLTVEKTHTSLMPATETVLDNLAASKTEDFSTVDDMGAESVKWKPHIVNNEWLLNERDVDCIAIGAGILGSGGGGNPYIGKQRALQQLKLGRKLRVIAPESMSTGVVVSCVMMGAPVIIREKLPSNESANAFETLRELVSSVKCKPEHYLDMDLEVKIGNGVKYIQNFPKDFHNCEEGEGAVKVTAVMAAEMGGVNSFEPVIVGAIMDLPILDADGMGRAFPEIQMFTPFMYRDEYAPSCLSDERGIREVVIQADSPKHLENHFRALCVTHGCMSGCAMAPLSADEVENLTVKYSLSRVWRLGRAVVQAQATKRSPVDAIMEHEHAVLLLTGKIVDVQRRITGGFTRGRVSVEGLKDKEYAGTRLHLDFQNEYLIAYVEAEDGVLQVRTCVPNLIMMVDTDSGEPVNTDEICYGLRVSVLSAASAPIIRTPRALEFVGPKAFGYEDVEYVEISDYVEYGSVLQEYA